MTYRKNLQFAGLKRRRRALQVLAAVALLLTAPTTASALDYEVNDIRSRELAIGGVLSPSDIDPRAPGPCSPTSKAQCTNLKLPVGTVLRGSARRHRGHVYTGVEALAGLTWPTDLLPAHPWLGGGAMIGLETAADGFRRVRGYGEIGLDAIWANTSVFDVLTAYSEAGIRIQVQQFERPHVLLLIGVRAMTNFRHLGYAMAVGVGWTFD